MSVEAIKLKELKEELAEVFRYEERYRETGYIHPDVENWEDAIWRNRFTILSALEIAAAMRWRKCGEEMPGPGENVLIRWEGDTLVARLELDFMDDDDDRTTYEWCWIAEGYVTINGPEVTHWMPLPAPPKEGE